MLSHKALIANVLQTCAVGIHNLLTEYVQNTRCDESRVERGGEMGEEKIFIFCDSY